MNQVGVEEKKPVKKLKRGRERTAGDRRVRFQTEVKVLL